MKRNASSDISQKTAKIVAATLDSFMRIDANSASCCILYQPKAPDALDRYKK